MATFFLVHGAHGHNKENWFPWLIRELKKQRHKVIAPNFPTPENQNLDAWLKVFKKYEKDLTPEIIFVGHSLGVPFILTILEKYPAHAAFLIAGFIGKLDNEFDPLNKTIAQRKFDFEKIKNNCKKFTIFHSTNDPYVKHKKAEELSEKLNTPIILIKNAGHFNAYAGYSCFADLMKHIRRLR